MNMWIAKRIKTIKYDIFISFKNMLLHHEYTISATVLDVNKKFMKSFCWSAAQNMQAVLFEEK